MANLEPNLANLLHKLADIAKYAKSTNYLASMPPIQVVFRAGLQPRCCACSVPRRTSTAMLCMQCSVLDLNRDPVSSVFRAGPQPRSCEVSVPRRTSTAMLCVQCSAPDLDRDAVRAVFRAGPQPRSCEFSVPRRTSTAIV